MYAIDDRAHLLLQNKREAIVCHYCDQRTNRIEHYQWVLTQGIDRVTHQRIMELIAELQRQTAACK